MGKMGMKGMSHISAGLVWVSVGLKSVEVGCG